MNWYGRREDPAELRRRASANLTYLKSGGLVRERLEKERRLKAEKEEKARRKARKAAIRARLKLLKVELKENERFYKRIEQDKADIGIRDAAHKQGALEEVEYAREGIIREIGDLRQELKELQNGKV